VSIRNKQIVEQIEELLKGVKAEDVVQHRLMVELLSEVYVEYNTGKNGSIEQKLYKMITAEAQRGECGGSTE
jgi:hypothetical protein